MEHSQRNARKINIRITFLFHLVLIIGLFSHLPGSLADPRDNSSGETKAVAADSNQPIHIKSDRMEVTDQSGKVLFSGNVEAHKGDLTIHSDKLEVIYAKEVKNADTDETASRKVIRTITAIDHVRIASGGKVATGEMAIYDKPRERIIISGSAQVWEGPNRIRGDRITIFLNEDRTVVEGTSREKVEAVVYPSE